MIFYAHSDSEGRSPGDPASRWQLLAEHLRRVANLAAEFARAAGAGERLCQRARALGLLHDLGKYRPEFQKLLRGEIKKAPHSIYGAAVASARGLAPDVAFAVAGHHAGMPDPASLKESLFKVRDEAARIWDVAVLDCPEIAACVPGALLGPMPGAPLQIDCSTRLIFSCLVDADRLDTAANAGVKIPAAEDLRAGERLDCILRFAAERAHETAEGPVKRARAAVLDASLNAAGRPGPLFSLTVPTGGAKTLSAMAFALRRATLFPHSVRRVIVVIPYLSIIEQNAKVYRDAFGGGAVLEHHSGIWSDEQDDSGYSYPARRLATENWDAPVIVTTSVRFFEALFSNKPGDLRRMHNIARSVVILDEVQTLPRKRVAPILSMMRNLAEDWGVTFVFSTATQPAFERREAPITGDPRWPAGTLDEIIANPKELFSELRRVEVTWPQEGHRTGWPALADGVARERQALVVVNTRGHALKLYRLMSGGRASVLHLSNSMCAAHRLERLAEIRRRLDADEECIVVSTQLVEAGVDLDFPAVWRAMGPLDSIAQAAGRCDRSGRLTMALGRPGGRVTVFEPEDDAMPRGAYREASDITRTLAATGIASIDAPAAIRAYFDRYYEPDALDLGDVEEMRQAAKYATVGREFRMIDEDSRGVIVPYDESATRMLEQLHFGAVSVLRGLQRYTVNLNESEFRRAAALGAIYRVCDEREIWAARPGFYNSETGLCLDPGAGDMVI